MTDDMFQARVEPLVMNFHCKLPTRVIFDVFQTVQGRKFVPSSESERADPLHTVIVFVMREKHCEATFSATLRKEPSSGHGEN